MFSILFVIVVFIFATIMGMFAYIYYFHGVLSSFPYGIILIYLKLKAQKFVAITILGLLVGYIYAPWIYNELS
ncbi:hypothetical protein [Lacticaseibacillus paracasei]|uniref:hypothetical protein n=1 Tax=Lacticaseibacillus paracasei TaxID=1597 RepID=UPI003394EA07